MIKKLQLLFLLALLLPSYASMALEQGDPAAQCELTSWADQQKQTLAQFKGKVVYVDFWASWCGPCAKSFPFLNQLDNDLKAKGLQILGVNLDEDKAAAQAFLDKYPASFSIVSDSGEQCARSFAVKGMPSSYLIDKKGLIRHVHLGFRPSEAEEVRALIEQLLAEDAVKNK
ncbi:TlpA disulfide reductase family protein [Methylosoma difficile]